MSKLEKRTSRVIILTMNLLLALSLSLVFQANENFTDVATKSELSSFDTKVFSKATIDEEFEDNSILLTLNGEATRSFKEYSIGDFPEVELMQVQDLTIPTTELAKKQIVAERTKNWSELNFYSKNQMLLKVDNFRRVLYLTLIKEGKEDVLQAIKLLEKRDDIIPRSLIIM